MLEGGPSRGPNFTSRQFCFLRSFNFLLFCKCMNWLALGRWTDHGKLHTGRAGWSPSKSWLSAQAHKSGPV